MSLWAPVLAAFIGASTTLAGVFINNWLQLSMRKEKFKELVYKERFAIYRDLIHYSTALLHLLPELRIPGNAHEDQTLAKVQEFTRQRSAFHLALSRAEFIAAEEVLEHGRKLMLQLIAIPEGSFEWQVRNLEATEIQLSLSRATRKDLGIDPFSDSIKDTIYDSVTTALKRLLKKIRRGE